MSRRLVALLALATRISVANLCYVQPLTSTIGAAFGVRDGCS